MWWDIYGLMVELYGLNGWGSYGKVSFVWKYEKMLVFMVNIDVPAGV